MLGPLLNDLCWEEWQYQFAMRSLADVVQAALNAMTYAIRGALQLMTACMACGQCEYASAGKTMLAKAVAHHTTAAFIRVVGSEFVQKYLGEVCTGPFCLLQASQ